MRQNAAATDNDWISKKKGGSRAIDEFDDALNKTQEDFKLLIDDSERQATYTRMRGMISYDILDLPENAQVRKLLKKLRKYNQTILKTNRIKDDRTQ